MLSFDVRPGDLAMKHGREMGRMISRFWPKQLVEFFTELKDTGDRTGFLGKGEMVLQIKSSDLNLLSLDTF